MFNFPNFTPMKPHYIHKLIAQGEHQQLDFKFEISDSRKIAKTFVAFANTDGGKLLIGVKDNGNIAGVRSEEEKYMAEAAAQMYSSPNVKFDYKEWMVDGKKVLEVSIPRGDERPYYAHNEEDKWRVYIRVKDQNILANKVLINAWKRKARPEGTYVNYSDNEKLLLVFLEENDSISLSRFRKLTNLSTHKAENILTNFLALDIIEIEISEKQILYKLSKSFHSI